MKKLLLFILTKMNKSYLNLCFNNWRNSFITSSKFQTKEWRKTRCSYINQEGEICKYTTGKKNECEKYQINHIERITGRTLPKSKGLRINKETHEMEHLRKIHHRIDSFEWTEDFDGEMVLNEKKFLFNLKMVCDAGGSQTRTLLLVYDFIKTQLEWEKKNGDNGQLVFINILDGDCSYASRGKFSHLLDKYNKTNNIFVGDMKEFEKFFYTQPQ